MIKLLAIVFIATSTYGKELSLNEALEIAFKNNPTLMAQKYRVESEQASVSSKYALPAPMIGISELKRGNTTTYGTLMQKIEFPIKYILRTRAQKRIAEAEEFKWNVIKLELRSQVISTYSALYSVQKILELTQRDLERLKELARTAEAKYAAGTAPQYDSMKAHVALTQVESTLINLKHEEEGLQSNLSRLLNEKEDTRIEPIKLSIPDVRMELKGIDTSKISKTPEVKTKQKLLEAAEYKRKEFQWNYAPDFQFRYQRRLGGMPSDSHIFGAEISIPLWFWGNASKVTASAHNEKAMKWNVVHTSREIRSTLRILKSQIESDYELLKIFETSLIPQALASYNASTSAYKASRIRFIDYLDAERSLLEVEKARYRIASKYIQSLTQFETKLGRIISGLGVKPKRGEK